MKKHALPFIAAAALVYACNGPENHTVHDTVVQEVHVIDTLPDTTPQPIAVETFDITNIPVSTQDIGIFPFFKAPEGYKYQNAETSDAGKQYLAINGKLVPFEGKVFNANLDIDQLKNKSTFNAALLEKSYNKLIVDLGGVKLNSAPVTNTEMERIGKGELIEKKAGFALDYNGRTIHTYVIRQKDAEVWIQFSLLDKESGNITILQKGDAQTLKIDLLKADDIKKEIAAKGKAILHINFDVDKATLGMEGQVAVTEIQKLLQEDASLKLSIEGHTDNTGSATKNKELSLARANTVLNTLVKAGIAKDRLKAKGFGAEKPMVSNDTDEGKAQNRRVELVKI
ncbi:OmpA family protein [Filimonas lacunae]|uniref:OmpA family protein n=1 Tax=Filimonas lacunae TaxID=477680 RepID=A0A173MKE8_9BACT|nr:OmpA family protein [Filimonas lacunae]BAV08113.1 outer membrane protein [Filimonas lacunae]SIT09531.1 OmpA family protein [Filimonas lacunae]